MLFRDLVAKSQRRSDELAGPDRKAKIETLRARELRSWTVGHLGNAEGGLTRAELRIKRAEQEFAATAREPRRTHLPGALGNEARDAYQRRREAAVREHAETPRTVQEALGGVEHAKAELIEGDQVGEALATARAAPSAREPRLAGHPDERQWLTQLGERHRQHGFEGLKSDAERDMSDLAGEPGPSRVPRRAVEGGALAPAHTVAERRATPPAVQMSPNAPAAAQHLAEIDELYRDRSRVERSSAGETEVRTRDDADEVVVRRERDPTPTRLCRVSARLQRCCRSATALSSRDRERDRDAGGQVRPTAPEPKGSRCAWRGRRRPARRPSARRR